MGEPKPWSPAEATTQIRRRAQDPNNLKFSFTGHFEERLNERGLLMGDMLHVLKFGYVYGEAQPAKTNGYFRYRVEGSTPNSNGRSVAVVVIPHPQATELKIVSIMWRDEDRQGG